MAEQEPPVAAMTLGSANEMAEPEPPTEAMTLGSDNEMDEQEPSESPPSVCRKDEISGGEPTTYQPVNDQPMGDQAASNQHNGDASKRRVFDNDMLFTEVEKYPDLYLKDFNDYVLKVEKKKQWVKICESLYPEAKLLSSQKMKRLVKKTQEKWTMLRFSYFERRRSEKQIRDRVYDLRNCCSGGELFTHTATVDVFQDGEQFENRRQFADGMAPIHRHIAPTHSMAHMAPITEPMPSTSTLCDFPPSIPSTSAHFTYPPLPIENQLVTVIYEELLSLNTAQLNAIGPKILFDINDIKEQCKSKIKILQTELMGSEPLEIPIAAEETFTEQEAVVQETLAPLSQETSAAAESVAEKTLAENESEEEEEEGIYPSSYGRPKNDQGEIIYPETDTEDFYD